MPDAAAMPSIGPLRRMSMRMRSGWWDAAASIAPAPVAAVPATWYPRRRRVDARSIATIVSSSTMRIRACGIRPSLHGKRYMERRAPLAPLHVNDAADLSNEAGYQLEAQRVGRGEVELRREADTVVLNAE